MSTNRTNQLFENYQELNERARFRKKTKKTKLLEAKPSLKNVIADKAKDPDAVDYGKLKAKKLPTTTATAKDPSKLRALLKSKKGKIGIGIAAAAGTAYAGKKLLDKKKKAAALKESVENWGISPRQIEKDIRKIEKLRSLCESVGQFEELRNQYLEDQCVKAMEKGFESAADFYDLMITK
jgi:hypothetical protein